MYAQNYGYHWPKTLSASLNVLVNWKVGKRHPAQKYESSQVVALTTKGNPGGFRGYFYNFGKSGHMAWDCPEPSKEEGRNSGQAGEDAQIHIKSVE